MFTQDNKVLNVMYKIFDLIFVSLIWLVTCIPLITIGAATASAYNTVIKVHRQARGYVWTEYFHSFKENFLTTIPFMPAIFAIGAGLCVIGYLLWPQRGEMLYGAYLVFTVVMLLVLMLFSIHLFLLTGRFPLTRKQLFRMALRLSVTFLPQNLLILFVCVGLGWITLEFWPCCLVFPGAFIFFMTYWEESLFHKVIRYENDLHEYVEDPEELTGLEESEDVPDSQDVTGTPNALKTTDASEMQEAMAATDSPEDSKEG